MPVNIRTFRNTDVESICRVWNEHFQELGVASQLLPLGLELGCLAKPFFHRSDLLVAELDEEVVGFAHVGRLPADDLQAEQANQFSVAALCVSPSVSADIAMRLLEHCEKLAVKASAEEIRFRPMLPHCAYYLGYGPADSMIGTTSGEQRTCEWLRDAGFVPRRPTNLWELDLARFNAPVDRMQLQIRRTAHVDRQVDEPLLPWWQACVLGHTEAAAFQLTDRAERRVLYEVLYWTVAPELQLTPNSVAWLWPPLVEDETVTAETPSVAATASRPSSPLQQRDAGKNASVSDRMVFLLAESLRELQSENIDVVRTVSSADHAANSQLLRRLGFKSVQSGMVFCKPLRDP